MGGNPRQSIGSDSSGDAVDSIMGELEKIKKEFSGEPTLPELDEPGLETALENILTEDTAEPGLLDAAIAAAEGNGGTRDDDLEDSMETGRGNLKRLNTHSDSDRMTLQVSGPTDLRLEYEFGGQTVTIGFEGGCLVVRLGDGSEFRIPARGKKSKAA